MEKTFKALVVEESGEKEFIRSIREKNVDDLPEGELLVKVSYSSLNYKDALSASGNRGVTKTYPHTPGIDAAGVIVESRDNRFRHGDEILVTGFDLGQNTAGGFGQFIRIPAEWAIPLPSGISLKESMILGTAGLTAAIGIHHLQTTGTGKDSGPVVVTGATGGVGTLAVSILSKIGYSVFAATGKTDRREFLKKLGCENVIHRDEVQDKSDKLLLSTRWAGAIETVGGIILDTVLRQTGRNGTVACCGNVLGEELNTNIYPFILRGVRLMGIDSGNCQMSLRVKLWNLLADEWKPAALDTLYRVCRLEDLATEISRILSGNQTGRVLVSLKD